MHEKIKLEIGEFLSIESRKTKGPLAETDIATYSIINTNGDKVGSVVHTEHTSIKGLNNTQRVEQRDINGVLVLDTRW